MAGVVKWGQIVPEGSRDKENLVSDKDKTASKRDAGKKPSSSAAEKKSSSKGRLSNNVVNSSSSPGPAVRRKSLTTTNKKSYRLKKISAQTVSKWPLLPKNLQTTVLTMLQEAISPFAYSEIEEVGDTLDSIRVRVQRALSKMKAPKESWNDVSSLKSAQEILTAEKARLEDVETTLQEELRQFEQQETGDGLET